MPGLIDKAQPAAPPGAAPQQGPEAAEEFGEEAATPEEQQSYEEAMDMIMQMLYVDDKTSATIMDMLQPNAKVDSIVKAAVLIIQQVDQKLDLDEAVVPELVMEVPDRLIELAEEGKGMTFNDGELKAILGATQEMVMQVIDVDAGEARRMMANLSPQQKQKAERDYKQMLSEAEQGVGAEGMVQQ